MAIVRDDAFVIQSVRFGETSLICRLLTRERGVVPVIAKGVRGPKSRFGARLDAFRRLQVTFYDKPGREIQTLSQADMVEEHPEVVRSLERMEAAGAWFRFLRAALPERAPAEPVFDLAALALRRLGAVRVTEVGRWETWHRSAAAAWLGLAPRLESCAACDRELPDPRGMALALEEGGLVCADCAAGRPGARFGPREYALIALYHHPEWELVAGLGPPRPEEAAVQETVGRFVAWHMDVPLARRRR